MLIRFRLHRPTEVDAAIAAYGDSQGDTAYVAGGTELLQVMKMGFAEFETLVDLKRIAELRGIEQESDGTVRIGATTTHREIERSALVQTALPALAELERDLANIRVRNTGTLGGNLAFAEPHSDPATLLLVYDARVELAGSSGRRELPLSQFTLGPLFTARSPEEIIVAIRVPPRQAGEGVAYAKAKFFERPAVSVAMRVRLSEGGVVAADVAIGSMTDTPSVVPNAGSAFVGGRSDEESTADAVARASRAIEALDAIDDHNGSADYKRHLATALLARVARSALAEASVRA